MRRTTYRVATAAIVLTAALFCGCARRATVTFVLRNSHSEELAFNMDRGWQPNLFAYRGKPPRAKWILMFPRHCYAACTAPERDRCPVCPEPESGKAQLSAQKFTRVAPGDDLSVPWDGQVFVYEKTRGKRKGKRRGCECHRTEPAPPGTYTVRACGLRLTKSAERRTQLQCVNGEMTLPASSPQVIELDFGSPDSRRAAARRAGR